MPFNVHNHIDSFPLPAFSVLIPQDVARRLFGGGASGWARERTAGAAWMWYDGMSGQSASHDYALPIDSEDAQHALRYMLGQNGFAYPPNDENGQPEILLGFGHQFCIGNNDFMGRARGGTRWSIQAWRMGDDNHHFYSCTRAEFDRVWNHFCDGGNRPDLPDPPSGSVYLGLGNLHGTLPTSHHHRWYNNTWQENGGQIVLPLPYHLAAEQGSRLYELFRLRALHYQALQTAAAPPPPPPPGPRLWTLLLNGTPVATNEELLEMVKPLASVEDRAQMIADTLWHSLTLRDPESAIADLAVREPVMLMVDFEPIASLSTTIVPAVVESDKDVSTIIVAAAAGVLLRGGLSDHFQYEESGRLVINPDNPPTLEQGLEMLRRTLEMKETSEKLDNHSAWTLGMLGDQFENLFGDAYNPDMVMEATGKCYNTYITALTVYRARWADRRHLSFTHHKEVHYAKIDSEESKTWLLDTSEKLRLSVAQQRKLISFVRIYGHEQLASEIDGDTIPEDLMERLEVKSVNRNFLFYLRSEGRWFEYRGPFEHIPNGAHPILNTDTKCLLARDGTPEKLQSWVPVGIEVPSPRGHAARNARRAEEAMQAEMAETVEEVEATQAPAASPPTIEA